MHAVPPGFSVVFKHDFTANFINAYSFDPHSGRVAVRQTRRAGRFLRQVRSFSDHDNVIDRWRDNGLLFSEKIGGIPILHPVQVELESKEISKFYRVNDVGDVAEIEPTELINILRVVIRYGDKCIDSLTGEETDLCDLQNIETICIFADFTPRDPLKFELFSHTEYIDFLGFTHELFPLINSRFDVCMRWGEGPPGLSACFREVMLKCINISMATFVNISEIFSADTASCLMTLIDPTREYVKETQSIYPMRNLFDKVLMNVSLVPFNEVLLKDLLSENSLFSNVRFREKIHQVSCSWRILEGLHRMTEYSRPLTRQNLLFAIDGIAVFDDKGSSGMTLMFAERPGTSTMTFPNESDPDKYIITNSDHDPIVTNIHDMKLMDRAFICLLNWRNHGDVSRLKRFADSLFSTISGKQCDVSLPKDETIQTFMRINSLPHRMP